MEGFAKKYYIGKLINKRLKKVEKKENFCGGKNRK